MHPDLIERIMAKTVFLGALLPTQSQPISNTKISLVTTTEEQVVWQPWSRDLGHTRSIMCRWSLQRHSFRSFWAGVSPGTSLLQPSRIHSSGPLLSSHQGQRKQRNHFSPATTFPKVESPDRSTGRGVKLIFPESHIGLAVTFKGPNIILRL